MKLSKRRKRGLVLAVSWLYVFAFGLGLYQSIVNERHDWPNGIAIAALSALFTVIFTVLVLAFLAWGLYGALLLIDFSNKSEG